jgi:chromatin remodeling complex protein RSC6
MAISKKAAKAAAVEEAPAAPPAPVEPEVVAPTDAAPAEEAPVTSVVEASRFEALLEKLLVITTASKELALQVRVLQKDVVRLQKEKAKAEAVAAKNAAKKEKKAATAKSTDPAVKRSPSGFAKPTRLSEELCSFLGVPAGTEMARTDVTRMLNNYIKQHGLQDPTDKRSIKPNEDLQKILEPGDVTYFNLQAKIKRHFIKA